MSQLNLALRAGISGKHLSFVETGRAQPGRDVVLRLATALNLPLRDRNAALVAAGYAPIYRQASLEAPEMAPVRRAVEFILRQQEPYPAIAMDRLTFIYRVNRGADRFLRMCMGDAALSRPLNLSRLLLAPDGLRPHIVNWQDVARITVARLRHEVSSVPGMPEAQAFLEELLALPGLPPECLIPRPEASAPPVVSTEFRKNGRSFRLFNMITTLGTPQDVTLQELRIECSFPADDETDVALRALVETPDLVEA